MLLATVNPEAAASIGSIKKVGVGNRVVYHARAGYMRDRRTSFPADVLRQNEDGSLDLFVIMEREDFAQEERVPFRSHNQPHHCWSAVEDVPGAGMSAEVEPSRLTEQIAAMGERIADLTQRIMALENKRGPGRPPKPKPPTASSAEG